MGDEDCGETRGVKPERMLNMDTQENTGGQAGRKFDIRIPKRKSRTGWFKCSVCHSRLAPMDEVDGKTVIRIGPYTTSHHCELDCEICGEKREFISMAVI